MSFRGDIQKYAYEGDVKHIKVESCELSRDLEQPVPDNIANDLKILFVGINPGFASAKAGHHFAGPTNHFWPCLHESGLTDRRLKPSEDVLLPEHYQIGITNLSHRATRTSTMLTLEEQRAGVPSLVEKIRTHRPHIVCFVGRAIWEIFVGGKRRTGYKVPFEGPIDDKAVFQFGLQPDAFRLAWHSDDSKEHMGSSRFFVMPSTSGLVSQYQKKDKVEFFRQLKILADA
ncbi:hypothetical protein BZG36_01554 [Bifiguratus adelaidae]|uniref:G/T mismatch-specific thymine DNA glycosylase n=1 Tax=Bifiguratus adelaidae TaxID=1938954 RepID=A0A261Y420_9FUNG|nr:hypothetical protein BZG36_01554 [Bifiguratus adelaidae]